MQILLYGDTAIPDGLIRKSTVSSLFILRLVGLIRKLKVNMTRKFLLMKNVNLSVLISNFDIKLSKTEPFFSYSLLKIKFLHKKVSGDLGRVFGLVT